MKNKILTTDKNYQALVQELKSLMEKGLHSAYKAVDNIKVQTYWQIGERIVREELRYKDRAGYGKFIIQNLSDDLSIEKKLLYRIIRFYNFYPIVASVMRQLSWTHYYRLIDIEDNKKRTFYGHQAVKYSWSVRELNKQIKAQIYENTAPAEIQAAFQAKLPTIEAPELFKNTYDFDFLQLKLDDKEKILENLIIQNIESFLKELGQDFSFFGRQMPIKIDNQTHYIDLVLFNRAIPCTVLVDLKMGKIDSGDIGQMNKYIGYYRQNRQYEYEKDTIGLIIGKDAGKEEIHYTLGGIQEKIFIATYKTKLPSKEKIKKAVHFLER